MPGLQRGNRYFNVVFSGSYESAVKNSSLSETQRLSQEMMSCTHGAPTFYHLDIIEDRSQPAGRDQPGDATPVNGAGGPGRPDDPSPGDAGAAPN